MGSDAIATFFPYTPAIPTRGVTHMRAAVLEMDQSTGNTTNNLEAQLAVQTSDDGETWGTPVVVDSSQTANANEKLYGASWTDLSTTLNAKRFFRAGVETTNQTSSTSMDKAYVSFQLEGRTS